MNYEEDYDIDDLKPKKSKKSKLLDELRDMEDSDFGYEPKASSFLPSSYLKPNKDSKEKYESDDERAADDWFADLMDSQGEMTKTRKKIRSDIFNNDGIIGKKKKGKKKGKKKKGELTDFKREFEPEMSLYKNLLVQQNKFTDSLQREYDSIKSVKSSSRGVTKQMADLIENITQARALSMQLVDKHVNAKKLIAELSLKEKKEFGQLGIEGENMADFASSYLKQMLNERQTLLDGTSEAIVSDYNDDEMLDEINSMFGEEDERPEEIDKYLKYEHMKPKIYIVIRNNDIENYEFIAKDEDGNIIDDYPLPNHTTISVNWSTMIATDVYGKKYTVIEEE